MRNILNEHLGRIEIEANHNFDLISAKMFIYLYNKSLRRVFEAGAISLCNSVNTHRGFYKIFLT